MKAKQLSRLIQATIRGNKSKLRQQSGLIAEFCGLSENTVVQWIGGNQDPMGGAVALKLWHFFVAAGYIDDSELSRAERVNPYGAYLGKLVGYSIIPLGRGEPMPGQETVTEICGRAALTVLRAMRGENNGFIGEPQVKYTLEELRTKYDKQLQEAVAKLRRDLGQHAEPAAAPTPLDAKPAAEAPAATTTDGPFGELNAQQRAEVLELARRLGDIEPLIRLATEHWTDEQRAFLRSLTTAERLFWLSRTLGQLCSARAFESAREQ